MTTATTFPAKMTLVHARELLSNRKVSITFTANGKCQYLYHKTKISIHLSFTVTIATRKSVDSHQFYP